MPNPDFSLSPAQLETFIADGVLRLDGAFPETIAAECRAILWRDAGVDPADPASWTKPVIRLGMYGQPPFREAANTPLLQVAYDALVGPGRWQAPAALGTFPIRFPSPDDPGDAGWHIDVSFGYEAPDFMDWRANVASKGRALLMLFLFTEIGAADAPTRIRLGSHIDMARRLAPAGAAGLTLREMAADDFAESAHRPEVLATGAPGAVYLCHPLLVHTAQPHRGTRPRIIAQPPLLPKTPLQLDRPDAAYSPVELAIRRALA